MDSKGHRPIFTSYYWDILQPMPKRISLHSNGDGDFDLDDFSLDNALEEIPQTHRYLRSINQDASIINTHTRSTYTPKPRKNWREFIGSIPRIPPPLAPMPPTAQEIADAEEAKMAAVDEYQAGIIERFMFQTWRKQGMGDIYISDLIIKTLRPEMAIKTLQRLGLDSLPIKE